MGRLSAWLFTPVSEHGKIAVTLRKDPELNNIACACSEVDITLPSEGKSLSSSLSRRTIFYPAAIYDYSEQLLIVY